VLIHGESISDRYFKDIYLFIIEIVHEVHQLVQIETNKINKCI